MRKQEKRGKIFTLARTFSNEAGLTSEKQIIKTSYSFQIYIRLISFQQILPFVDKIKDEDDHNLNISYYQNSYQ